MFSRSLPLAFLALLAVVISVAPAQRTLEVPSQYKTIQAAIDAAGDGDTVRVAPGRYPENLVISGKAITVLSRDGAAVTTISGGNRASVVTFLDGIKRTAVLEGFTLVDGQGDSSSGGGVTCRSASPTIRDNRILWNVGYGGGIRSDSPSVPIIADNLIQGNDSIGSGGGIYCSSAMIFGNTIEGNRSTAFAWGGGIDGGDVTVLHNTIVKNSAEWGGGLSVGGLVQYNVIQGNYASEDGGGIGVGNRVLDNEILGNFASYGGGVFKATLVSGNTISGNGGYGGGAYQCDTVIGNRFTGNDNGGVKECKTIIGNVFLNNVAGYGGAIETQVTKALIANNVIANNRAFLGGGILDFEGATVIHNTIVGNVATGEVGGICGGDFPSTTIIGCILWNNQGPVSAELSPRAQATYSCIKGGWPGTGNFNQDPEFVDVARDDFHLRFSSPCVNRGSNQVAGLPATDFEGDCRIADGTVDIGADEFSPHLYHLGTPKPAGTITVGFIGKPGTALYWGFSHYVLDPPASIPGLNGLFYLNPVSIAVLPLGRFPSTGVITLQYKFDPNFPKISIPMQALMGDQLSNLDVVHVR
jgi:hypothetical protein